MKTQKQCPKTEHQHQDGHVHGPDCGHAAIKHDDHFDYLVDGHLHHPAGDTCICHGERR
jgi:hypothetical protein